MDTLIRVPSAGTPKRTVRVDDELWLPYQELCELEGTNCAEDIRAHIEERVKTYLVGKTEKADSAGPQA